MTKATITADRNTVTVKYTDDMGERRIMEISAPHTGGYLRFANGEQVCQGLFRRGHTLEWSPSNGTLVALVRREWKRHQRVLASLAAA